MQASLIPSDRTAQSCLLEWKGGNSKQIKVEQSQTHVLCFYTTSLKSCPNIQKIHSDQKP